MSLVGNALFFARTYFRANHRKCKIKAILLLLSFCRKFFITNPTNSPYTFQWIQDSIDGTPSGLNDNMVCRTPKGTIDGGKKFEILFEYAIETLELVETFWRFVVDNHSVSVPFLLVAYGMEPTVSLDRSHINFKEILLGISFHSTDYGSIGSRLSDFRSP